MKIVLAAHGTRGDVEPCAAVGLELLHRGHEVCIAAPPNLLGFVESAGLSAVGYGPDSRERSARSPTSFTTLSGRRIPSTSSARAGTSSLRAGRRWAGLWLHWRMGPTCW